MFGIYELKYVNVHVYSHKVSYMYMYDVTDKVYVWCL